MVCMYYYDLIIMFVLRIIQEFNAEATERFMQRIRKTMGDVIHQVIMLPGNYVASVSTKCIFDWSIEQQINGMWTIVCIRTSVVDVIAQVIVLQGNCVALVCFNQRTEALQMAWY